MNTLNISVAGSTGRMGRAVLEALAHTSNARLHAALERPGCPELDRDAGEFMGAPWGVKITDDVEMALPGSQVLVDFTRPEATLRHMEVCQKYDVNMVIGTTGLNSAQKAQLEAAAHSIAMVFAPNMSVGINLLLKLLEISAQVLHDGYDVEIIEAHHRHKVDAPSGTALRMGEVVAKAQGRDLNDCAVYGRHGETGERSTSSIGFATVRGGDIVGDHTVMFAAEGERVELTHRAGSRATFAHGALRAARFVADRKTGLYDMMDVLGLR
ncbi:MAG: 4-hydroxy-tetrahydrodipicolinate reductase [Burkholderiales bacterium]